MHAWQADRRVQASEHATRQNSARRVLDCVGILEHTFSAVSNGGPSQVLAHHRRRRRQLTGTLIKVNKPHNLIQLLHSMHPGPSVQQQQQRMATASTLSPGE